MELPGKKSKRVLESMMTNDDTHYKPQDIEKKSESDEQQSETMSLLLCEETVPGSPAPVPSKDPLIDIGRSPSSSSGGFVHPSMPSQSSNYMKYPGNMPTALLHQQYQSSSSSQSAAVQQAVVITQTTIPTTRRETQTTINRITRRTVS
jgi:hypothetical protein